MPGDDIGPEIVAAAMLVLEAANEVHDLDLRLTEIATGMASYRKNGVTLSRKSHSSTRNGGEGARPLAAFALRRASISLAKSRPGQVTYASSGDGSPEHIAGELLKSMAEINKILKLPNVRERFATLGADPVGETAEQFGSYIKSEVAKFAKVARERRLELE
jgi:hypothetical protein